MKIKASTAVATLIFLAATFCVALNFPLRALADTELNQVTTADENGHFAAILQFNTPVAAEDVKVDVLKDALDITIANSKLIGEKNFVEVGKSNVKSISSSASGNDVLTKIIFAKGVNPESFKDSYRVIPQGDQVKILFKTPDQEWSLAALGIEGLAPVSLEPETTAPVNVAAKDGVGPETTANASAVAADENYEGKKENEIPVLMSTAAKKSETRSPFTRLGMSLIVIAALAFGLVHFSKWWQKRHGKTVDNNRIRILTQHHLGPKKSLAIIRVAGETILLGVTDQNISMIKTLALLEDEDVPEIVPRSFAGELQKSGGPAKEEESAEESAFAQIRDRISSRIKEMRPLS